MSDDGQHRNPARGLGALARSPPGEADLISSGPTHLPAPVASTQASYSFARLVVEAYTSIDGSIHPSGSGTATLRALRPHLLDRYGCTPPAARPPATAPRPPADRVMPVPCPRAGGLREMGARARRAAAVAARHVPFAPGPPPRPLHPIMSDPSVQRTRLPPSSHPTPHGSKTGPCACTQRCPNSQPEPGRRAQRCAGSRCARAHRRRSRMR